MNPRTLAAALLLPLAVLAQPTPLLNITDPEGDDVGDGSLVYPRDASAFAEGDLDLRSLSVFADGPNLRFEATFRNPIRDPASVRNPGGSNVDLSASARRGFYAFNLDVYIDTDRVPGSGNTMTLPGRGATLDPAHAWEKVVVLTPRPELMKRQFLDALLEVSPANAAEVTATTDRSVFFATDIRVRGRTVSFTVPGSFIDAKTLAGASLTAMVTLAKLSIEADITLFSKAPGSAVERLSLGVAQPEPGRPLYAMGYTGDRAPANAVVDLLSPDVRQQAAQLAPGGLLTGLNRDNKFGAAQVIMAAAPAAAAAAPAAPVAAAASSGSWFSRALGSLTAVFGTSAATSAAPAPAAPANPQTMQSLMAPQPSAAAPATAAAAVVVPVAAGAAAAPAAAAAVVPATPAAGRSTPAAASTRARDAAFFEEQEMRLRTLERLRKSGLISEAEYQQKRKEVLEAL